MHRLNNIFNQNFFTISYKLLHDSLFALLILLSFTLLAEELIPGIISEHIGISKIIVIITFNILLIIFTHRFVENSEQANKLSEKKTITNKKTILVVSIFCLLLLINSFLKIGLLLNAMIVIQVGIISYLLYIITFKK